VVGSYIYYDYSLVVGECSFYLMLIKAQTIISLLVNANSPLTYAFV
jgi:hypothetical protein